MAYFRCGGKKYSEEKPRVSFLASSNAGNIQWVGSVGCDASVDLVNTDTHFKIEIPAYTNFTCTVSIDEEQIEQFKIGSEEVVKIYEFSNKTTAKVTIWNNVSGNQVKQIRCTVW